jgi:hypothetical protein
MVMDKTVLEIVASIEQGNFDQAVDTLIAAEPEKRSKVLADALGFMDLKMFSLRRQLNEAQSMIAKIQKEEDSYASAFIDTLCMSIKDHKSALEAGYIYGKKWFQTLEFSMPVKINICQRLIDTVAQYNPSYASQLWENAVNATPEALAAISFNTADTDEG